MSYPLVGINFDHQLFTPEAHCAMYYNGQSDGIITGCNATYSGFVLHIDPGWIMAGGKLLQLASGVSIPINQQSAGYARVIISIDLDEAATVTVFNQAWLDVEYAPTEDAFATLEHHNMSRGGRTYQAEFYRVALGASGITDVTFISDCHSKGFGLTYTLSSNYWTQISEHCYRLSLYAKRMHPELHLLAGPAPESLADYTSCKVYLREIQYGRAIWEAYSKPSSDLTINLLLL